MDAVTINQTDYHHTQVIHVESEYGAPDGVITADFYSSSMGHKHDSMSVTVARDGSKVRRLYLPSSAMDNLCALWQGEQESATIADLRAAHDARTAEIERLEARNTELETSLAQAIALQSKAERALGIRESGTKYYIDAMCEVEKERDALQQQVSELQASLTEIGVSNATLVDQNQRLKAAAQAVISEYKEDVNGSFIVSMDELQDALRLGNSESPPEPHLPVDAHFPEDLPF